MKGRAFAIAALLLLGALGLVASRFLSTPRSDADDPIRRDGSAARSGERLADDPSGAAGLENGDPESAVARVAVERIAPPPIGPTVVLLEAETSKPRPDARVWSVRRSEAGEERWHALEEYATPLDPLLTAVGHEIGLDASASARLDGAHDEAWLFADAGDRHARRLVTLDQDQRLLLRLVRRAPLLLRSIDADGHRQRDVPLLLQTLDLLPDTAAAKPAEHWKPGRIAFLAVTDHVGDATCSFGSELLDAHLDEFGLTTTRAVAAALAFPCRDPSATLVDPRRDARDPVELVAPQRSTLRLRAVDLEGRALAQSVTVVARAVVADDAAATPLPVCRDWPIEIAAGGTAELLVEAECAIELRSYGARGDFLGSTRVISDRAGDTMECALTLSWISDSPIKETKVYAVEILDVDGRPLRSTAVWWQIDSDPDALPRATARSETTDESGRFQVAVDPISVQWPLHVFVGPEGPIEQGTRFDGRSLLAEDAADPAGALTSIQLVPVPLLLDLKTVDPDGRPIERVDVSVMNARRPPRIWHGVTGDDGHCRIRSRPSCAAPWLAATVVRSGWWRPREFDESGKRVWIETRTETDDLEVVLHRKGTVRGVLRVDPGISLRELTLALDPDRPPDVELEIDRDGAFKLQASPSTRDLVVGSRWSDRPVEVVTNVELREGEVTDDPRLHPIDLRGELRQVELRVIDVAHAPIEGASIFLLTGHNSLVRGRATTDPFGRALVTTPDLGGTLAVATKVHALRRVLLDRAETEVVLSPAPVVVVKAKEYTKKLAAIGALPRLDLVEAAEGRTFAALAKELGEREPVRDDDGDYRFAIPVFGDYAVYWWIPPSNSSSDYFGRVTVDGTSPIVETVTELTEKQFDRLLRQR